MTLSDWLKDSALTQAAIAAALGCSAGLVSHWANGREVSARFVLPLARLTGYQVRPHDMRPDLYPQPHDAVPASLLALPDLLPHRAAAQPPAAVAGAE